MSRTCTGVHQGRRACKPCLAVHQLSTHRPPRPNIDSTPPSSSPRSAFPGRPLSFLIFRCSDRRPHSLTLMMSNMRSLRFPVLTLTVLYNTRIAYHVHCCFHSSPFRLRCRCARPCLPLVVTAERPQVSCLALRRPPCPPSLSTLPPALLSGLSCICIAFSFCLPHRAVQSLHASFPHLFSRRLLPAPLGQSSQERI